MTILLLTLFLIVFEAAYEGFKTRGKHILSEWVENIYLFGVSAGLLAWVKGIPFTHAILFWKEILIALLLFLLIRFALFDTIWNICAKQNIFYIGKTKSYDKILNKIGPFIWWVKFCILITAIAIIV